MQAVPPIQNNNRHINLAALIFIITTTALGTIGLGLINPVAPFLVTRYINDPHSAGLVLGWLTSAYAICQFIAAPGLGALSDRYGRRPILLICLLGSALGYLLLGIGGALWVLILGRVIDGLTGGNFGVTFAYVADITPVDERGKYFGWLGAISGVALILGPAIGGLLAKISIEAPLYLAAAVTFANVALGLFFMPESLPKANRTTKVAIPQLNPLSILSRVGEIAQIRALLLTSFLIALGFGAVEGIGLLTKDTLAWDAAATGAIFVVVGITDIFAQGVLLQRLLKRFKESQVAVAGMALEAVGLLMIGSIVLVPSSGLLLLGTMSFAMGDGLFGPALSGLLARNVDASAQGQVQGGNQAVQSLARIIGPLAAGILYDRLGHSTPYVASAMIVALAVVVIFVALPPLSRSEAEIESTPA